MIILKFFKITTIMYIPVDGDLSTIDLEADNNIIL